MPGSSKQLVGKRVLAPLERWLKHLHDLPTHGNRNLLDEETLRIMAERRAERARAAAWQKEYRARKKTAR